MRFTKLVFAAITAALLLAMAAGTAAALRSISSDTLQISLLSTALTFTSTNLPGRVVCEVKQEVTLNARAIAKTVRGAIARTRFTILRCAENRATVEARAVEVNYLGFLGTLPDITGIVFEALQADFTIIIPFLAECRIRADAAGLQAVIRGVLGNLTGDRPGNVFTLRNVRVERRLGFCPTAEESRMTGTFEPSPAGTRVRIELI